MRLNLGRLFQSASQSAAPILDERLQRRELAEKALKRRTLEDAVRQRQEKLDLAASRSRTLEDALKERQLAKLNEPVTKPDRRQVVEGQVVDIDAATATPIAGFKAKEVPRNEARIAAREDRLQQNYNQEPAIKQAGLLANAVAQLRASAEQKTGLKHIKGLPGECQTREVISCRSSPA